MFLLLNCARGLLVPLCCVHPFLHNKELKDETPKSLCFSPFTPVLGRGGGWRGICWVDGSGSHISCSTYLPTSLSWPTGYSSLEKGDRPPSFQTPAVYGALGQILPPVSLFQGLQGSWRPRYRVIHLGIYTVPGRQTGNQYCDKIILDACVWKGNT